MKKLFFALILSFFFIPLSEADENLLKYEKECREFIDKPKIELISSYGRLQYKFDKDAAYLKRETAKKFAEQDETMSDDFMPVGLTKVRDVFDFDFTVGTLALSQGYTCVYPESVKVRLEYFMPTIYILNSLEKDSCMYNVALRHENTHMQIYIEALDYFLPKLKKFMVKQFNLIGVKVVSDSESSEKAAKDLNEKYLAGIQNKITEWHKEVEHEQLKLDTPEHYIIENMICQTIEDEY